MTANFALDFVWARPPSAAAGRYIDDVSLDLGGGSHSTVYESDLYGAQSGIDGQLSPVAPAEWEHKRNWDGERQDVRGEMEISWATENAFHTKLLF